MFMPAVIFPTLVHTLVTAATTSCLDLCLMGEWARGSPCTSAQDLPGVHDAMLAEAARRQTLFCKWLMRDSLPFSCRYTQFTVLKSFDVSGNDLTGTLPSQ